MSPAPTLFVNLIHSSFKNTVMNIRKIIPLLLLLAFFATALFYACGSSQSTTSGTGGSRPDTAKATTAKTPYVKSSGTALSSGTGGSKPDTTKNP